MVYTFKCGLLKKVEGIFLGRRKSRTPKRVWRKLLFTVGDQGEDRWVGLARYPPVGWGGGGAALLGPAAGRPK